jgi:hypothetical protein
MCLDESSGHITEDQKIVKSQVLLSLPSLSTILVMEEKYHVISQIIFEEVRFNQIYFIVSINDYFQFQKYFT